MKSFRREKLLESLEIENNWDVVIIGGGATGLGIAVDASSRGFKTLLIEQNDFAKGTSSRSTKLVHGGVRYLAQGNISLVKEALKERGLLLKNAPHLTWNESFIIPCYSWFKTFFYAAGLKMYDWLSGKLSLGKSEIISRRNVTTRIPNLNTDSLKAGVLYHDGSFDDARLALNLAQTSVDNGGVVMNYCKAVSLQKDPAGKISTVVATDLESGKEYKINAATVINATGVFADEIIRMDHSESKPLIRPSQGIHLVLDESFLDSNDAIMIPHTDDGRVLFAIPWHGKVLVGTTDTPLNTHSLEPHALEKEIDFVLKNASIYLRKKPQRSDILCVFAGLRPLAASQDEKEKTKEISRSHKIIISESGLVTIIGGKWTTYRKMAEDTLDKMMKEKMLPYRQCITENLKIHGYATNSSNNPLSIYGSDEKYVREMMNNDPELAKKLNDKSPVLKVQVVWAVKNEMARTVEDVLARRTRLLFTDAMLAIEMAPAVAEILAGELFRNDNWEKEQVASFTKLAQNYIV